MTRPEAGAIGASKRGEGFHTGDIGCVRPDGMLVITGRSSEVINRGGVIVALDSTTYRAPRSAS